eukprot:evm.model.scf_2141.1 EVM.evm.TU.scf_2141.1   scf_2141:2802-6893(+)
MSRILVRAATHPGEGPKLQRYLSLALSHSGRFESTKPINTSATDVIVEELEYKADEGARVWVPLRVIRPPLNSNCDVFPAVVLLHPTGSSKDAMKDWQMQFASAGYLTAAIDCCYHGDRCITGEASRSCYQDALARAWRTGIERPFLLDNVWDLIHLLDYLETRPDVDRLKIGMT